MAEDQGYCYIVIFRNGFVKGGKSKDFFKRYKTHKATATRLGISVKKAFCTCRHSTYHENEKRLLSALSEVCEERVGEFFRGVSEAHAVEALGSLGLEISALEECVLNAMDRNAFVEIAKDREITSATYQALFAVLSVVDFENWIQFNQAEMADAIGMKRQNFGRAMRKLEAIELILRGPKVGRSVSYRLNPNFGWKSSK